MTVEEIAKRIENPEMCSLADIQALEALIHKYPYAQTLPILLLQTLGRTKSFDFEEKLKEHAFRVSDRTHLYYLINQTQETKDQTIEVKEASPTTIVEANEPVLESTASIESDTSQEPEEIVVPEVGEEIIPAKEEESAASLVESSSPIETEVKEENVSVIGARQEMELTTDNSKFAEFEVEEMSFEPVQVHFEDNDFTSLDFEKVPEYAAETNIETIKEEPISKEPVEEIDSISTSSLSSETNGEEETKEKLVELKSDNKKEDNQKEAISAEGIEEDKIQLTETVDEEIPTPSFVEEETEEMDAATSSTSPSDFLTKSETETEPEEVPSEEPQATEKSTFVEDTSDENNVKSIAFFDPTMDIDQIGKQEELEKIEPSAFNKAISLDLISPSDDEINDDLTSHALSQSYPLSLDEEVINEGTSAPSLSGQEKSDVNWKKGERSFVDWLKVSATTHSEEYQVKQRANEILEKFIKEEPKITRISKTDTVEKKATEFFKVSKIAKASLSEIDMPVSETLAEIFEAQGNFSKAIEAYQQLMLLIPEKKSFFANQIKKLKTK